MANKKSKKNNRKKNIRKNIKKTCRNNYRYKRKLITRNKLVKQKSGRGTRKIQNVLSGGEYSIGILIMVWGGGTVLVILIIYMFLRLIKEIVEASIKADQIMDANLKKNSNYYGTRPLIGLREAKERSEAAKWEEENLVSRITPETMIGHESSLLVPMEEKKVSDEPTLYDYIKKWWEKTATREDDKDDAYIYAYSGRWDPPESEGNGGYHGGEGDDEGGKSLKIKETDILQLHKYLRIRLSTVSSFIKLLYFPTIQKIFLDMALFPFSFKTNKTNKKGTQAAFLNLFKAWNNSSKDDQVQLLKDTLVSAAKNISLYEINDSIVYTTLEESASVLSDIEPEQRLEQLQQTIKVKINSNRINPFTSFTSLKTIGNTFKGFSLKEMLKEIFNSSKKIKTVEVEVKSLKTNSIIKKVQEVVPDGSPDGSPYGSLDGDSRSI